MRQFHLQGLRPRYVEDCNILVAAASFPQSDRLLKSAISACRLHAWNTGATQKAQHAPGIITLQGKKVFSADDQTLLRAHLGIDESVPLVANECPDKALHRYLRHARNVPDQRLLIVLPVEAFKIDHESIERVFQLSDHFGIRLVCQMTPASKAVGENKVQVIARLCEVHIIGKDFTSPFTNARKTGALAALKNSQPHAVFVSKIKNEQVSKKRGLFWATLGNVLSASGSDKKAA